MPFQKGQSGNPGGRPKGATFAAVLGALLEQERAGKTTRERIAEVAVGKALKGDLSAIEWIANRTEGKVPDKLESSVDARHELHLSDATLDAVLGYYAAKRRAGGGAA